MLSDNCQRAPLLSPEPPCPRSSLPWDFRGKSLAPIAMKNISLCSSNPPGALKTNPSVLITLKI